MADISGAARILLKTLVERHIRDGQPVGSKTLLAGSGPAGEYSHIRNASCPTRRTSGSLFPHTSAGGCPTALGYRLFVGQPVARSGRWTRRSSRMRAELNPDKSCHRAGADRLGLLSSITARAGLVTVPRQEANQLRRWSSCRCRATGCWSSR